MQRNKKLLIMLGVLVFVSVVTFGVSKYETHKENIKNSGEVILSIDTDKVTALSWEKGSKSFSLHKDEYWIYDADEEFPVNDEKIKDMLGIFEDFTADFTIENVEDTDQYGFDNPEGKISITAGDRTYTITLGDYSRMDSKRYVSVGDGNIYLAQSDPMNEFDVILSNLIKHDEIPEYTKINDFSFAGAENYSVIREPEENGKSYCKDDIYYVKGDAENKSLDTDKVENYFRTLDNIYLTDYATYKATDTDLETYGLKLPTLSVKVDYTYEEDKNNEKSDSFTFSIGLTSEGQDAVKKADEADDEEEKIELLEDVKAYLRINSSKIIYEIKYDDYTELLKASYNDLRHSQILPIDFDDATKITFTVEGNEYIFEAEEKDDEIIWQYNGNEIDISDVRSAISGLRADSFTENAEGQKEEIRFTCYLNNETYPKAEVVLYRYDGKTCVAALNGKTIAFVLREDAVDLIEAVNKFALD